MEEFDVAIIGAGINGAGIARDAALRGLRVIILDKNDMCSGTSAVSSRLIHGGLRYLEYGEVSLVYESLRERRVLRHIAAHLVEPVRINIPIFAGSKRGKLLVRLGMIAYDILSFGKQLPRHEMLGREQVRKQVPGLRAEGLLGAARYSDAQVRFAERLVLENLLAARSAGASIRTYCALSDIRENTGRVASLRYMQSDGTSVEIAVSAIVNAAGPWVDEVLERAPSKAKPLIGGTKGSHIIVGQFTGAPEDAFYVEAKADGRPVFIIPWHGQYLIGTTDIRYDGSLDCIRASREEVDYLIAETNRVFPDANLRVDDIHFAYAGVRPLPRQDKGPESAITRRHIIKSNRNMTKGLISIIGGKLTTYRNLAEQAVDKLGKVLRRKLPQCRTADTVLPGAWGVGRARDVLRESGWLSEAGIDRLLSIYGGRAAAIVELGEKEAQPGKSLNDDSVHLVAEVLFTVREEFAQTLADIVFRRMMIGFNANQGRSLYDAIGVIVAKELDWSDEMLVAQRQELIDYADSLKVS